LLRRPSKTLVDGVSRLAELVKRHAGPALQGDGEIFATMSCNRGYETIDPVLFSWAGERGLRVCTSFKDDPIRAIGFSGPSGDQVALMWLSKKEPFKATGRIEVVASAGKWSYRRAAMLQELPDALTEVHNLLSQQVPVHWVAAGNVFLTK
jgi:hypothetical protein